MNHGDKVDRIKNEIISIHNEIISIYNNLTNQLGVQFFVIIKEDDLIKTIFSDAPYYFKRQVVVEFLEGQEGDRLLEQCPHLWDLITAYKDKLNELLTAEAILKEVMLKLSDPLLSTKEELELRKLKKEQINYIKELKNLIQNLENQIKQKYQNNPQCLL